MRRQRRLGAHDAALALEAFEQRGLLAADIGAGAHAQFDVEGEIRAAHVLAERPLGAVSIAPPERPCATIGYSERR